MALVRPGTAAPQSFYGAPYLDQRSGRTLSSFLGFGSKTNSPVPVATAAGPVTITAPVAVPPGGPVSVNLGKVDAPVSVSGGLGGGGLGQFLPSAIVGSGAPSVPVAKPVLRSPLQPPPAAPPRPILYNIRFYPDLSFEQTSPDRYYHHINLVSHLASISLLNFVIYVLLHLIRSPLALLQDLCANQVSKHVVTNPAPRAYISLLSPLISLFSSLKP